ncbi:ankyrin repeat-containing domain protein [Aspergillus pseudoustus]|uniref:Ankyrin repeat-containing domain protein n=1 Tax=Aspergillus pseudoustus TaxID=1810923 RepID=A0ABR4IT62_9EURO
MKLERAVGGKMPLRVLPNELLLLIWAFCETKDMGALILTCRHFHDTFNSLLYQHAVKHCPDVVAAWIGKTGQLQTMREFVEAGGNVTSNHLVTPLFSATTHGQDAVIEALIEMGIDLEMETPDWKRLTALFKAVVAGRLSTVRLLLDAGAAVNARASGDDTPLMAAASSGHDEVVMLLLERGADRTALNYSDRPVLSYALEGGCGIAIIELLLETTPKDLLDEMDEGGPTPLGLAAQSGNIPAAKQLLAAGATLEAGGRSDTPLRVAIEAEEEEMVRFLLDAGADVNETPGQYAPLPLAADLGLDRILALLLERGADPTFVLPWGDVPIDNAIHGHHYRCAKLLLDAGALTSYRTETDDDPVNMLYPLIIMDDDMAIPIAEKLAISEDNHYRGKALLWAARDGNRRIVELSLENGADIEVGAALDPPITPLMIAAMNGHGQIVKLLLQRGANAYFADINGLTALAVAAQRGWVDAVLEIVQSQPNVNNLIDLTDDRKRTPLFHATVTGHLAVASILLAYGSRAMDITTNASRTTRTVVEDWSRRHADQDLDFNSRYTFKAMLDMFNNPAISRDITIDRTGKQPYPGVRIEIKPTLCSPGDMTGLSHYDRWICPGTGSQCYLCGIAIPDYGARFHDRCSDNDVCPECKVGCSPFLGDAWDLREVYGGTEHVTMRSNGNP